MPYLLLHTQAGGPREVDQTSQAHAEAINSDSAAVQSAGAFGY